MMTGKIVKVSVTCPKVCSHIKPYVAKQALSNYLITKHGDLYSTRVCADAKTKELFETKNNPSNKALKFFLCCVIHNFLSFFSFFSQSKKLTAILLTHQNVGPVNVYFKQFFIKPKKFLRKLLFDFLFSGVK
eukprot:Pompholyxophrys_punicea_v1_NODE_30_length_5153_cov_17.277560.p3 type:complete len:132 gc:universal NODE_30_length_5153_cov_17.277560:2593-2198(-)